MKNFTTDAINIKTYPLSENDNIVIMFSKQKGLIKGVAKGVRRPKSKLGARMQMLVANNLMLYEGKNLDTICQAQALNTFAKLRQDLDKLTYSMYLAEIIGVFCREEDSFSTESYNEGIYELFYTTLEKISNSKDAVQILLNVLKFQLKFMHLLGYGIELENCLGCGSKIDSNPMFSLSSGGVLCERCQSNDVRIKMPTKIREFLLTIANSETGSVTKYDELVNERVVDVCYNLLKKYISAQSPKVFKSLNVLESIK